MTDKNDKSRRKTAARWTNKHLYEPIRKPDAGGRHAPKLPKFIPSLVILLIVGLLGTWFIFVSLARLRGSDVSWIWPNIGSLSADGALFDVTRSTATLAALVGGLFAVVYAYRKQRVDEAGGKRADDEAFSKRYQDAADQLGHDKAAVRLAGVYSLARLADDWPEQRQTCVDVLCAYARMPISKTADGKPDESEVQTRRTLFDAFKSHLNPGRSDPWCKFTLNFDDAVIPGVNLDGATFGECPTFRRTKFVGNTSFRKVKFLKGALFKSCEITDGALEILDFEVSDTFACNSVEIAKTGRLKLSPRRLDKTSILKVLKCYEDK